MQSKRARVSKGYNKVKQEIKKVRKLFVANERLPKESTSEERQHGSKQNGALLLTRADEDVNRIPERTEQRQIIRAEEKYALRPSSPYPSQKQVSKQTQNQR